VEEKRIGIGEERKEKYGEMYRKVNDV